MHSTTYEHYTHTSVYSLLIAQSLEFFSLPQQMVDVDKEGKTVMCVGACVFVRVCEYVILIVTCP